MEPKKDRTRLCGPGYALGAVGAVSYLVGIFLPFAYLPGVVFSPGKRPQAPPFFAFSIHGVQNTGWTLAIGIGALVVLGLAIAGLIRRQSTVLPGALAGAALTWTLSLGWYVRFQAGPPIQIGFWAIVAGFGFALLGGCLTLATRPRTESSDAADRPRRSSTGATLGVVGAGCYVVGLLLPYSHQGGRQSLMHATVDLSDWLPGRIGIGGSLVGGAAVVAAFAVACLVAKRQGWARGGFAWAGIAWSLTWIGLQMSLWHSWHGTRIGSAAMDVGLCLVLLGSTWSWLRPVLTSRAELPGPTPVVNGPEPTPQTG